MVKYTNRLRIPKANFDQSPWHQDVWAALDQIDSVIYNALLTANTSVWVAGKQYAPGTAAIDSSNGQVYVCLVSHTSSGASFAAARAANPTYWQSLVAGINPRNAWQHNTTYNYFDMVYDTSQGIVALCVVPHTSNNAGTIRTDSANWAFVIDYTTIATASGTVLSPTGMHVVTSGNVQGAVSQLDALLDTVNTSLQSALNSIAGINTTMTSLSNTVNSHSTSITSLTTSVANANTLLTSSLRKNYIVNSGMRISQENGSVAGTINGYYAVDQFYVAFSHAGNLTAQQVASPTPGGSPNRFRVTVTTADASMDAGDYLRIEQPLEGSRVADLRFGNAAAKSATIQFGCKGPAGTYCVAVRNGGNTRSYVGEFTIAAGEANTDVVKSVTIPGDVTGTWAIDNTVGMYVSVVLMCGATFQQTAGAWAAGNKLASANQTNFMAINGNVFELFDVGMYLGSTAPPFALEHYDLELRTCLRYWEKSYAPGTVVGTVTVSGAEAILGAAATTQQTGKDTRFSVQKRVAPSVTLYSTNTGASGKFYDAIASADITAVADSVTENSARTYGPTASAAGGQVVVYWHWKADARM